MQVIFDNSNGIRYTQQINFPIRKEDVIEFTFDKEDLDNAEGTALDLAYYSALPFARFTSLLDADPFKKKILKSTFLRELNTLLNVGLEAQM